MMLVLNKRTDNTLTCEIIDDEGQPQYQALLNRFKDKDIRWLCKLWGVDVPTVTAKVNEICESDIEEGAYEPECIESLADTDTIRSIITGNEVIREEQVDTNPLQIRVRSIDQLQSHSVIFTNVEPATAFREALNQTWNSNPNPQHEFLVEWSDTSRLVCLDIDYHNLDVNERPTFDLIKSTVEKVRPHPYAWHPSHGKGCKLYFVSTPGYTAKELASIAGISWIELDSAATFDLTKSTRHPCYGRKRDNASPPCSDLSSIHYLSSSCDLTTVKRLLSNEVEPADVEKWLEEKGYHYGQVLPHSECPIEPTEDNKANVYVGDKGLFCHRCYAKGYGNPPGLASYASLVGCSDTRLTTMVKNCCHLEHAKVVLENIYPCVGSNVLTDVYRVMLKIVHGSEDPRIHSAMRSGEGFVRIRGQWVSHTGDSNLTNGLMEFVKSLPATKVVIKTGKQQGELVNDTPRTVAFLNNGDISHYGYPEITFIRGCKIYGVHNAYPQSEIVKVVHRREFNACQPRYVQPNQRMPIEDAWKLLECEFPGVNRNYVQLLLAIKGASEGRLVQCPFLFVSGPSGAGKCFAIGTKVIMYDGTTKKVEDVRTGDKLIGPDSKPRTVLNTSRGFGPLYKVTPKKGEPYTVTGNHVLSLKKCSNHNRKIVNISVFDFIKQSECFRKFHMQWSTGVDWPRKDVSIPPYILGVWLGDGSTNKPDITSMDKEIVEEWTDYTHNLGMTCTVYRRKHSKASSYYQSRGKGYNGYLHPFMGKLYAYGLKGKKFIPHAYKTNCRTYRLELLAGLIDTDGCLTKGRMYSITQKNRRLANDIAFLTRSLGFYTSIKEYKGKATNSPTGKWGIYYHIFISGKHLDEIPCRIPRKQAPTCISINSKATEVTSISVERVADGEWAGFEVDSDHLFLLDNFTVVHNSTTPHVAAGICGDRASEPTWVPNPERFRQSLMDAAKESGFLCINEAMKLSDAAKLSYTQALDPMLCLTEDSRSHVLYVGSVPFGRLPIFVVTDVRIPAEVVADRQLARRFTFFRLDSEQHWTDTLVHRNIRPHQFRLISSQHAAAADSILSYVIDTYFSYPQSLQEITKQLQITQDSPYTVEQEETRNVLHEFFLAVCKAPRTSGTVARRFSPEQGWRYIDRLTDSPLLNLWNELCDGQEPEKWGRSRQVDSYDWAKIAKTTFPIRCDYRLHHINSLYVRFRSTESERNPRWVNGEER